MKIGAQGFTIRNFTGTETEIAISLKKLRDIGYRYLQVSAFGEISAERLHEIAQENDLKIIVTHTNPDRILNDTDRVIAEHKILQCPHVGIGMMPQKYLGSIEGARGFLKDYQAAAQKMNENGLKLHYHNHGFEYEQDGGKTFMEVMAEETDPALWGFILDVYWVQYSGKNPIKEIERLKGRIDICHLKDMSIVANQQRTTPVMEGNLDFDGILNACLQTGVTYAMVEQDDAYGKYPFDELKISLENLNNWFHQTGTEF